MKNPADSTALNIYSRNSTLYINEVFSNATIYDVTGKTIATLKGDKKSISISKGVYLVKATIEVKTYLQKTFVL